MRLPRIGLVALFCLLLAAEASAQGFIQKPFVAIPDTPILVPDEFVVAFDVRTARGLEISTDARGGPRVNLPGLQAALRDLGATGIRREFPTARIPSAGSGRPDLTVYYKVKLGPDGAGLDEALDRMGLEAGVVRVEPIAIHPVYATPNDSYYENSPSPSFPYDQWHYRAAPGIAANTAWNTEAGDPNVVVAILDSGVRYFHVDLGGDHPVWGPDNPQTDGNIWINTAETPGNGVDDDGNGYIDDTIGWDFVSDASSPGVTCLDQDCGTVDNDPDDGDGHGTHVAGTVGAITNNGRLVAGVAGGFANGLPSGAANGVKIMCLRIGFRGRYQGVTTGLIRMDWAAEAMQYVADQVDAGVNVTAVNCSWGTSDSGGLGAAVDALLARDVMIMHAAGNSGTQTADFLGGKDGVMNVAATDSTGAGVSFSNYGSWVDLAAPGDAIVSTYANPDDPDLTNHYIALLSGTSMSSPHACGVAALLESYQPALSGPDKFNIMVNTTVPYSGTRDWGSGILNAANALSSIQVAVPDSPAPRVMGLAISSYPNPARRGTEVLVRSSARQSARVLVLDASGRRVAALGEGLLESGENRFRWDGRDAQGRPAASGIYFLTVRTSTDTASRKMMLLR